MKRVRVLRQKFLPGGPFCPRHLRDPPRPIPAPRPLGTRPRGPLPLTGPITQGPVAWVRTVVAWVDAESVRRALRELSQDAPGAAWPRFNGRIRNTIGPAGGHRAWSGGPATLRFS